MANVNDKQDVGSPEPQETHAASGIGSWFAGVFLDPGATFGTIAASVELPHPKDASRTRDGTKWWVPFLIGLGLVFRQPWARYLALGVAFPMLLAIPFGTIFAAWTFHCLYSRERYEASLRVRGQ